jgi:hypothetical protein
MITRKRILVILCLLAFGVIPLYTSASVPGVNYPLKASSAEGPYQDDEFLQKANEMISPLSNLAVPNGTYLLNLKTAQQQMSKMKISPDLYPVASDINDFLYFTGKTGDYYADALTLMSNTNVAAGDTQLGEAQYYYKTASAIWDRIKDRYPGVTLYKLPENAVLFRGTI